MDVDQRPWCTQTWIRVELQEIDCMLYTCPSTSTCTCLTACCCTCPCKCVCHISMSQIRTADLPRAQEVCGVRACLHNHGTARRGRCPCIAGMLYDPQHVAYCTACCMLPGMLRIARHVASMTVTCYSICRMLHGYVACLYVCMICFDRRHGWAVWLGVW